METTSRLFNVIEENQILKPAKGYYKERDRIYLEDTEDTHDGSWPRVSDYTRFCNKLDNYDYKAVQNFLIGAKRKKSDWGGVTLHKVDRDKIRLEFKEPVKVYFGKVGEKPILQEVKTIEGKLSHEFYWRKNGRQNKIANGIEIFIEEVEYIN